MGRAHELKTFAKCEPKLGYYVLLGLTFGNALDPLYSSTPIQSLFVL
jgi:hypothetical protein